MTISKHQAVYLSSCCRRSCAISTLYLWEKATSTPSPTAFLEENPFLPGVLTESFIYVFFSPCSSWDLYHSLFLYQLFSKWNQCAVSWFLMLYCISNTDSLDGVFMCSVRHAQGLNVCQLTSKSYLPSVRLPAYYLHPSCPQKKVIRKINLMTHLSRISDFIEKSHQVIFFF